MDGLNGNWSCGNMKWSGLTGKHLGLIRGGEEFWLDSELLALQSDIMEMIY